jgi:hypothetical protein
MNIVSQVRPRAAAIFAHHIGQGPEVEGYGAKGWRQWIICSASCNCGWFVVTKADPLATPMHFNCSLEQCKAILLAGR